jgi:uncharacterized protein YprB with RNaseH-like and TPR domain
MDLYERLRAIKNAKKSTDSQAPVSDVNSSKQPLPVARDPDDEAPAGAGGSMAAGRTIDSTSDDAWRQLNPWVWCRRRIYPISPPDDFPHPALWPAADAGWEDFRFIDSETTGLSSGAGTIIFLYGSGRFLDGNFELTQWFVGDFPGEPAFLSALMDLENLPGDASPILVSYNGASFDLPLLRTRLLMNGMAPEDWRQLDLLYPSRRFYSPLLPDCRLGTIESRVLGIRRELDIPGSEVPDRYFDFQRNHAREAPESDPRMIPVLEHHASDISSLGLLMIHVNQVLNSVETWAAQKKRDESAPPLIQGCSARGLARQFLAIGDENTARQILIHMSTRPEDLKMLGPLLRRGRRWPEAHQIWTRIYEEYGDYRALAPMLVHLEHRLRDYRAAMDLIERGLSHVDPDSRYAHELLIRKKRIEQKLKSRT